MTSHRIASLQVQLSSQGSLGQSWATQNSKAHSPHWVLVLTIYVLLMATSGFACGVRGLPVFYQVLVAVAPCVTITLLWLTHLTDAGIIPASQDKDPIILLLEDGNIDGVPNASSYTRDPDTQVWQRKVPYRDGMSVEKYCWTCNIWRPPRASHCHTCGHCMAHFDHHCEVMGNCIAQNNHRFFAGFLVSAQVGCALLLGGAVVRIRQLTTDSPEYAVVIVLLVVYAYHILALSFGNAHCLFIMLDVTSKDLASSGSCCHGELGSNPPCCPGTRSAWNLLANLHTMCCAPVRTRWLQPFATQYRPLDTCVS